MNGSMLKRILPQKYNSFAAVFDVKLYNYDI